MGKADIEDALLQLDSLTKEELQFMLARNLELAHRIKAGDINEIRLLTESSIDAVKAIKVEVDQTLKAVEART
jgi:hypothetical protein